MTARFTSLAAGALLAVGLLAGCTDPTPGPSGDASATETAEASPSPSETAEAVANDADVAFAEAVLDHHGQSVQMHQMIENKAAVSEEVVALASTLFNAQSAEAEDLSMLLSRWDAEPTPTEGTAPAEGMLTDEQMSELATSAGPAATVIYLEGMIGHHEATITLAEEEIREGSHPDALAVAQDMITSQEQGLSELQRLLDASRTEVTTDGATDET